jgi:Fe-S cluster biosynthesis and repair protein YggX
MLTEKTLKKWRKDALCDIEELKRYACSSKDNSWRETEEYELNETRINLLNAAERILKLTQELMDAYLIKKG